ncbi:MAG TPA: phosphotransferase [Gemmataceae bacterium]|jgi:aminoglycoside phosphotransferase (APT) family kinase protein|nr:phosphotransferase [Gemmataceae bacterium]
MLPRKTEAVSPAPGRVDFSSRQGFAPVNGTPKRIANPALASEVAMLLGNYLSKRWSTNGLTYVKRPTEHAEGWETYTYSFQIQSARSLPADYCGPLILRIYPNRDGVRQARHEFAVLRHLSKTEFSVTKPLLLEDNCRYFGGPFLVRREAPGDTLLRAMLGRPRRLWSGPRRMAALQASLHRLPAAGFPTSPGPLLTRSLDQLADDIRSADWQKLRPGLDWLVAHRPPPPKVARILHLDFHPINLIRQSNGSLTPIDWPEADVGDPHADVGTTLVLTECTPAKNTSWLDQLGVAVGRTLFVRWYLRAYGKRLPLDWATLVYYRSWAALRRICRYGKWLDAGAACGTCKSCVIEQINRKDLATLEAYFEKWTGVPVRL